MSQWNISAAERREYNRNWRATHPTYHRDWMRAYRGNAAEGDRSKDMYPMGRWPGRKMILGIYVNVNILQKLWERIRP